MGVIAEWWWSCDVDGCDDSAEEPRYDEQTAKDDLAAHMAEAHEEETER